MLVTESAADTVIVSAWDVDARTRVGTSLTSAGFITLPADGSLSAVHLIRYYRGAIDWLVVMPDGDDEVLLTQHAIFEYRFYNPLRPIICLVDSFPPASLARMPEIIFLWNSDHDLPTLLTSAKQTQNETERGLLAMA